MDSVNSSKRLVPCGSSSDIISNLPSNILDTILTCLPMQDAARTCVLSKSWRFRWHHSPQLVFDDAYFCSRSSKSWVEILLQIFQILSLHRGPLHRCDLLSTLIVKTKPCSMDQFILFLTGKDIQEFTFRPWLDSDNPYRLPSTFFQCTQLTYLNLSNCAFKLPNDFIGFSRLICIEVYHVHDHLSHHNFNTFISKCPLLQRLKVEGYSKLHCLELDAPNLKYLYLDSAYTSILFKNVPVLSSVIIKKQAGCSTDIAEVFGSLPSIEHFSADSGFLMHMCRDGVPERLPSVLNHLKYVELSKISFSMRDVPCALLLIRSSPSLQKLKIKACHCIGDEAPILRHLKAPSPIEHRFNQLEQVTMENYVGSANQLEFVKFILAETPVLKKLTIWPPRGTTSDDGLKIVAAVTRFRRASSLAEIIFPVSD